MTSTPGTTRRPFWRDAARAFVLPFAAAAVVAAVAKSILGGGYWPILAALAAVLFLAVFDLTLRGTR